MVSPDTIVTATPTIQQELKTDDPRETWLDQETIDICNRVGNAYNIAPELLEAIIESESSGQQYVYNGNCVGLMQVNKSLHAKRMRSLGYDDIWDKEANVATGASLLLDLCEKYGDVGYGLMAYNGTSNVSQRTTLTPYAQKILNRSMELERIHNK